MEKSVQLGPPMASVRPAFADIGYRLLGIDGWTCWRNLPLFGGKLHLRFQIIGYQATMDGRVGAISRPQH